MQTLPPVSFAQAFKLGFQNYCKFTGRARRSEFFYFVIGVNIHLFFLFIFFTIPMSSADSDDPYDDDDDDLFFLIFIPIAFMFATLCPILSLSVRRLHDIGYSGAYILIGIIPFGCFFLLYLYCIDSEEGTNPYGPSPKYIMPVTNTFTPPAVIAVQPVVQPGVVVVPVAPTPAVHQPIAPYPQPNPMISPPVVPYHEPNPMVPPPMAPYPQQNPIAPPPVAPVVPYHEPNPIQPPTDPYYNSSDFQGQ